jgi:hypothetical protein
MLILGSVGCVNNEEINQLENKLFDAEQLTDSDRNKIDVAKEFSLLLGKVLTDKQNRIELGYLVQTLDDFGDAISVSAMLGDRERMAPSELDILSALDGDILHRKKANQIKESLISYSIDNLSEFKVLEQSFNNYILEKYTDNASLSYTEALVDFYSAQGLVVHIPYAENFDWELMEYGITMTYDPIIRDDWNEGYTYDEFGNAQLLPYVDDPYSFDNPTYVITYYHPDDFLAAPPIPTLPSPAANAVILGYNVNHTSISQADILLSVIPEMRLTDTNYIGLFGNKVKLQIFRGSNKLNVNFDGTIGNSASGDIYKYTEYHFSKWDCKNKNWKTVNIQFDPDWDMSENSQQIVLFSKHNISAKGKIKVGAKVGYDFVTKKPTAEATGSVEMEMELGSSKYRTNSVLSRRSVFAHIVGDTGLGTKLRNGNHYNVKGVGLAEFYFEHYFTDIPD